MPIIKTEIRKADPIRPGAKIYVRQRTVQDVFNDLEAHLEADDRLPDEFFVHVPDVNWPGGTMFPENGTVFCIVNFGDDGGIYLNVVVDYKDDIYVYNGAGNLEKQNAMEVLAIGKSSGNTLADLDRMNLAAASVTAAFYGNSEEVRARYANIGEQS